MGGRRLKEIERRLFSHVRSSTKLICFWRKHRDSFKTAECPIHQLIRLDRLEIHIALSNSDIDVRILAQG